MAPFTKARNQRPCGFIPAPCVDTPTAASCLSGNPTPALMSRGGTDTEPSAAAAEPTGSPPPTGAAFRRCGNMARSLRSHLSEDRRRAAAS
ncbi:hypothetical protein FQA47_013152 [Oryzias melastigma]|uniref:Uncharacterized protein n=1 Tax=Oryzias melastigma TaxID=30732 RepID=A0A834BQT3_ORYME|nr:hypothetical protein FQA47_013152 [Oryzias melastigma]